MDKSIATALTVSLLTSFLLSGHFRTFFSSVLKAGAVAGASVDCVLFPLDTIKTRLQSEHGFFKAGGFKRIYAGLGSSVVGSAPNGIGLLIKVKVN